ncbi:MAG: HigA family addiction module antitoxin [Candidatus Acidiferrales bacterium]|jgi:HTH-type transcriptional regulator/antitoxin HigA
MATTTANWIAHPGVYIKEEMEERGWSQRDLAFILGCSEQVINPILNGKRGISPEMAKALGEAFDVPAEFFANLQQAYDLAQARTPDPSVAVRRRMQSTYPVREMIKRGWIEQSDAAMLEIQLTRFFNVQSPDQIPHFAHAAKKTPGDITPAQDAWLYRVRQIARSISVPAYSEKSLRNAVSQELPSLLFAPDQARQVPRLLMECGVKFILVEKLPTAKIDGVCFWLDGVPVIGMSMQHDRIDNFWFVLRHEIEHVLSEHGKEKPQGMVDIDLETAAISISEEERIANEAAANFCVPSEKLDSWLNRKRPYYYEKDVVALSRVLERHPGIVVGQIRKKLNRYDYLTRYLVKIRHFVVPGSMADGWGQMVPISL